MSHQRTIGMLRNIIAAAMMASFVAAAPLFLSAMASPASAQQPDQRPPPGQLTDDARSVLSQYGNFVQHQVYGEVWIPSITPQGWHPYPPCHWVKSQQYGWYYDDQTPWGAIVHHYGRWTNDPQVGWFWVPGSEFSPGWVLWRTSLPWVGWAPMPPDEQIQHATADQFNTADFWIFMETAKFDANCDAGAVVAGQRGLPLVQQTIFVRDVNIVGGILVYVLPSYVVGPLIDINLNFDPWPPWFFGQIMIDWNWIWNNVNIIVKINNINCPPQQQNQAAAANKPPPPFSPPATPVSQPTCAGGAAVNAYGQCPTPVTHDCGPNMVALGNFCMPVAQPSCAKGTAPTRVAGGGYQCLPIGIASTCSDGRLVDGRCEHDPPPCTGGLIRGTNGNCGPIIVVQPNCGPNATNVGGRCTPNNISVTPTNPIGVVVRPSGGSTPPTGGSTTPTGGSNPPNGPDNNYCLRCGDCCVLHHPSEPTGVTISTGKGSTSPIGVATTPSTGGSTTTGRGSTPTEVTTTNHLPTTVFTTNKPTTTSSNPSFVLGRGGAGLNVFKSSGPSGPIGGGAGPGPSLARSTAAPIFHAMPSMSAGGMGMKR
jgi:hypothetical protein